MFHANKSNYKYLVVNIESGVTNKYLNGRDMFNEIGVSSSTFHRILSGKPTRKYKQYKFMKCRIPVDDRS